MQLSDLSFLYLFLPVTLVGYYIPFVYKRQAWRNAWLFLVSLGFYLWTSLASALFMAVSIAVNYGIGLWVGQYAKQAKGKWLVSLACVLNLGALVYFKFAKGIMGGLSELFGFATPDFLKNIILPLGISFYTFKILSYIIDVYRKKNAPQRNVVKLGLYLSFFPCAISGPIFKYHDMIEQIENRQSSMEQFGEGVKTFVMGMAKSVILGSQLKILSDLAFGESPLELSVVYAWLGAFAYTLYIYFDFSGYSQMAIGVGKMFGFDVPQNFDYPYISRSVSEYWRRWHITLGEWFQEYLYYPVSLGPALKLRKAAGKRLNRKQAGLISTGFTLLVVWLCTGVWHGANMTFVVWGLLNFVFVFIDSSFKPVKYTKLTSAIGFAGTFLITLFTKVIFNSSGIAASVSYIASMFGLNGNGFMGKEAGLLLVAFLFYIAVGSVLIFPVAPALRRRIDNIQTPWLKHTLQFAQNLLILVLFIISLGFVASGGHSAPLYANF